MKGTPVSRTAVVFIIIRSLCERFALASGLGLYGRHAERVVQRTKSRGCYSAVFVRSGIGTISL